MEGVAIGASKQTRPLQHMTRKLAKKWNASTPLTSLCCTVGEKLKLAGAQQPTSTNTTKDVQALELQSGCAVESAN
jgi:hypothetical protein